MRMYRWVRPRYAHGDWLVYMEGQASLYKIFAVNLRELGFVDDQGHVIPEPLSEP